MNNRFLELLIKEVIGTWESEGRSFGLNGDEIEELIKLLWKFPGKHIEYLEKNGFKNE